MSEKIRSLDARGLACPEPVIQTKKALEEGGFGILEVLVDNAAARDNVSRFAAYAKASLLSISEEGQVFRLRIAPGSLGPSGAAGPIGAEPPVACDDPADDSADIAETAGTVLITSSELGRGEAALGALLMKGFIYSLAESEHPPRHLIFMNSGVRLCVEGSESLANLRRLADSGTEILACGTCLDYYKLKESLGVGKISNMYEISSIVRTGKTLSL